MVKNVEMRVQGDTLVITIDLSRSFGLSGSGKSVTVATTSGNVPLPGHEEIKVGVNVYRAKER